MVATPDDEEGTRCPVLDIRDDRPRAIYPFLWTTDDQEGTRRPVLGTPDEHGRTGCLFVGDGVGLEEDLATEDTTRGPSHAGLKRLAIVRDHEVAPG